ncbi:hypothetical protein HV314_15185 [Citrobacter sp. RHBSTW-00887]|uniref:hypothetical protein n=1 Tax=Citrobacter sp. RHBSTW-00887 TaxID=2742668 RepID=UPI0015EA41D5|nr:hypothetical protein [Citrobacter sp. RHBSTW-00887]QLS52621.1 hypothetical protein HV314_15185 [Citrobacter sp. RHBSTW-00887]
MSSREKFEQAIKARFGDLIDYRVCKNSDGEYMAWDMQVAWWAWQASEASTAVQLANAESKCRELAAENAALKAASSCLVSEYMMNKGADNEFIACITPSKKTIGTGGVWDMWRHLDMALDTTPATEAVLAEARAQESKRVYESILDNPAVTDMGSLVDWLEQHAEDSASFAAQLRQGAAL